MEATLYEGFGFLREKRRLKISEGISEISIQDMPSTVYEDTILVSIDGVEVCEMSFKHDTVSKYALLEKYINKAINAYSDLGATAQPVSGTLLRVEGNELIIQTNEGIQIIDARNISLPELPEGMSLRPEVNVQAKAKKGGERNAEISYLTGGFEWNADYVMLVNGEDARIVGNATIKNSCGKDLECDSLTLVAGDIRRVAAHHPRMFREIGETMEKASRGGAAMDNFTMGDVGDFHKYTLNRPLSVKSSEKKRISFLDSETETEKKYIFDQNTYGNKIEVVYNLENSEEKGLGKPLPRGIVRIYSEEEGAFLGEDNINHVPKDEEFKVRAGKAFDLVAEKEQKQTLAAQHMNEMEYTVTLRNRKNEDVEIDVYEHLWGNWQVLGESSPHTTDKGALKWTIPVEANSEKTLRYNVRSIY